MQTLLSAVTQVTHIYIKAACGKHFQMVNNLGIHYPHCRKITGRFSKKGKNPKPTRYDVLLSFTCTKFAIKHNS